ncbi:MAG: 1-acyl-sn-glycerol-3-phosphate acyltransferase [Treponema sp.]|nr:1-acyl-sn-glycerol-3-phosphate acyltransferase [Treponema sp.]
MVQDCIGQGIPLEGPGCRLMPYKHGRPVIDLSPWFRIASAWAFYITFPIAMLFNFMQHATSYRHRWRIYGIRRAITVSNHTTFLDPVKITGLTLPRLIFQTLLEATVEFPVLGTYTRLLGGVPIPGGKTGYRKVFEICEKAFKYRRYLHFYPESECFLYNQRIREFRPGAFRLSAELDIPLIPLVTVFSNGLFKPWSFWGRSLPVETLVVLEPEYPARYVRRNEKGEITPESIREFAEAVRRKMQREIDRRKGSDAFYRGRLERIKGLND